MNKMYIGCDPGCTGVITTYKDGVFNHYFIEDNDLHSLSDILAKLRAENDDITACIELVHAVQGSAAKSTFSFGETFGKLQALFIAHKIPLHYVQPKAWQGLLWAIPDKEMKSTKKVLKDGSFQKKVDPKPTSLNACKRIFPNLDLRKNDRCKIAHPDKVDSILICEYARRMNL